MSGLRQDEGCGFQASLGYSGIFSKHLSTVKKEKEGRKEGRSGGEELPTTPLRMIESHPPWVHPCYQVLVGKDREVASLGFARL